MTATHAPKSGPYDVEYRAIGNIVDMVRAPIRASDDKLWLEYRNESPNPYYAQTASGLYLELYYSMPNTLWTPWGKYNVGGSGSSSGRGWDPVVEDLVERLGGTLHSARRHTPMGEIGEVYSLTKVDGVPLPIPTVRPRSEYLDYEVSKQSWSEHELRLGPAQVRS